MKLYFKSFFISAFILALLSFAIIASIKIYESTVHIKYGEYKNAIETSENGIRFFDYVISKK